ncbi:glycosyltransferase family 2 protein [Candidatus Omnitrophota bacterium]
MGKRLLINSIIILALIAIMVYVTTRAVLLGFAEYGGMDKFTSWLLIFGEFFIILHGVGYTLNIFRAYSYKQTEEQMDKVAHEKLDKEPSVAILVAARHEPKDVLEETFTSLRNLNYKNKRVYFLDDSSDGKYKREAEELSEELGLILFRREERHGAKAGIVNDCVKNLDEKYVVVFDADQTPLPDFLNRIVPIMEKDEKLAFVQTPQFYTNIDESRVAKAAAFQQAVFYEYICEGKSSQEAMFCCGTNIIFRKEALLDVGGLDESTVTEDFATSLKLHAKKWKSLYYNHVYAFGMGPVNLTGYFQQQYRWANGTISVFKRLIAGLITHPFSLKFKQWWEYFLSGSYYIVGLAYFILMLFPILYLLLGVPSFFARPEVYLLAFLPYIILSMSVFYFILKERNYKGKDLFLGQLLGSITFSVYIRAAVSAIIGKKTTFGITQKTKGAAIPYLHLWPQLSLLTVNYIAIVWGVNRFIYEREPAILINCFWALYHCFILSSVFYFNEASE